MAHYPGPNNSEKIISELQTANEALKENVRIAKQSADGATRLAWYAIGITIISSILNFAL